MTRLDKEKRQSHLGHFFLSNSDLFHLPSWPDSTWLMETKREDKKKTLNARCFSMALCTPLCYVWLHIEFTRYYYEWLIWECLVISVPVTICKNKWTAERLMCPTCCKSLVLVNCLVTVPPYDSLHTSLLWSSCVRSLGKHTLKANAPILCLNCKRWPFISKDDRFL